MFGDPELSSGSTLQHYFNTAAFVHPPNYQFGGSPRFGAARSWKQYRGLQRRQDVCHHERLKTEVRGEFFNVFNFANFNIPGHTLGNSDFGIISSALPARTVELALRVIF